MFYPFQTLPVPESLPDPARELLTEALSSGQGFLAGLLRPWNAYQLLIAIGLYIAAWLLARYLGPRIRTWLSNRKSWPLWRIKSVLAIQQRLAGILFVVLIWTVVWTMREITWPSRSYLLGIIGTLAFAWIIVALLTRLIRNPFLRGVFQYGAWAYTTLLITGLLDETIAVLDAAAVSVGDVRLSLLTVIQAFISLAVVLTLARFFTRTTSQRIRQSEDMSPSMQVLVVKALQILFYGLALFFGLQAVGIDLTGLAFLSGAIGVGLGFGLQKVVSNLVSGVIILLDKSIKPGDVISLGDTFGWIQTLGARYASVVTRDGKEYLIPNEDLITNQVVNWSHSDQFVRLDIFFGVAYGDDPHLVRKIAVEAAKSVDRVLHDRTPVCHIVGFGDSSVDYILRFWILDPTDGLTNIRGNVYLALWDTFKEHGISIPFPQREVRMVEPPLTADGAIPDTEPTETKTIR
ncbi:mechanosensitive ion channel family protein [Shimia ponticola]|uniref:mechanosensitive ion channel family protein n=1 Tax=Shimia ponticola TaxID=2582893 RepID=UPI0011BEF835|nr:mechanosensitive ion channel domain-containing protein [Shimia ponticola]